MTEETQQRLKRAIKAQADYTPSKAVQSELHHKSLVMVIAPTCSGKTYIMEEVARRDPEFSRVSVFTTRPPRADDQRLFRYYDEDSLYELLDAIESHDVAQYAIHPIKKTLYGTFASDFPKPYNLLATLSNSVEQMERVGFGECVTIGLVTKPEHWQQWFDARYPILSGEKLARLQEAKLSLEWLIARPRVRWVINEPEQSYAVAQRLIAAAKKPNVEADPRGPDYARALYDHVVLMLQ